MGDAAFRTGFRVARATWPEAVSARRRRQRIVLAIVAAVLGGAIVTVTELIWAWSVVPAVLTALGIALFAAAFGCFVTCFTRFSEPDDPVDWSFRPTGDWRRQERVGRQFAARPPAMDPADRDLVLAQVERARIPLVRMAGRTALLPVAWAFAWFGILATGMASGSWYLLVMVPVFGILQSASPVAAFSSLGRLELARRRAELLPDVPPEAPRTWPKGTGPTGSKTALPGERSR